MKNAGLPGDVPKKPAEPQILPQSQDWEQANDHIIKEKTLKCTDRKGTRQGAVA